MFLLVSTLPRPRHLEAKACQMLGFNWPVPSRSSIAKSKKSGKRRHLPLVSECEQGGIQLDYHRSDFPAPLTSSPMRQEQVFPAWICWRWRRLVALEPEQKVPSELRLAEARVRRQARELLLLPVAFNVKPNKPRQTFNFHQTAIAAIE